MADDDDFRAKLRAALATFTENAEAIDQAFADELHTVDDLVKLADSVEDAETLRKIVKSLAHAARTRIRTQSKTQQKIAKLVMVLRGREP